MLAMVDRPASRWWRGNRGAVLAVCLIAALGFAARLTTWGSVYTNEGIELLPYDSHYYVRFARLQLESFPRFTSVDPLVNFPVRPRIYWPPLHTGAVAGAIAMAGVGRAEEAAAWVDPVLALLWLLGLGLALVRALGPTQALWAGGVLALTPATIVASSLGNADHHVHEPFLHALLCVLALVVLTRRSAAWAVGLGLALGLARSLTTVAVVWVPPVALVFPLGALLLRRDQRLPRLALATGAAYSAAAAAAAAALGNLADMQYEIQGGFHVFFGMAIFSGAAAVAGVMARSWRWAALIPVALALLLPVGSELARAFAHAGAVDPLMAVVTEARPLLAEPRLALELAGPALILVLAFAAVVVARLPSEPGSRLELLLVTVWLIVGTVLAALQARFANLWVGGAAITTAFLFRQAGSLGLDPGFARRVMGALLALAAFWTITRMRPADEAFPPTRSRLAEPLAWLRANSPPSEDYGVLAHIEYGHLVSLWAERASIASTFSQVPWHVEANERAAALLRTSDEGPAYDALRQQRVRYVLATPSEPYLHFPDPSWEPRLLRVLHAPPRTPEGDLHAFAHFRLLHESVARAPAPMREPLARLYEVVQGATITGPCTAGTSVTLSATEPIAGVSRRFVAFAQCDVDARFVVQVAQPSSDWATDGARATVSEDDVRSGAEVRLQRTTAP